MAAGATVRSAGSGGAPAGTATPHGGPAGGSESAIARRDRFIVERLRGLPDDALVVNVGCGMVRRFERACGSRYLATDIRALPNVDVAADAAVLPLADGTVDVVLSLELLEHVPDPRAVVREMARILKPGGTVVLSVPSVVPRHEHPDFWRFTAEGLQQLGASHFEHGEVHVFGGTFEALGYLAGYYTALGLHVLHVPGTRVHRIFPTVGYWLDRRHANRWSSSLTALHTLALDLVFVGAAPSSGG